VLALFGSDDVSLTLDTAKELPTRPVGLVEAVS
jgi:hypothetical protein